MEQESNPAPDPAPRGTTLKAWLSHKRIRMIWIGIYFVLSFLCFLVFVPIVMMKNNSDGKCLLYADTLGFGQDSVCNYSIAIAVIFLITCTLRAVCMILEMTRYASKLPTKLQKNTVVKSIILLVDMIILLLLLVVASTISAGFLSLCDSLFMERSDCDSSHGIGLFPSGKVNDTFYTHMSIAQDSAWVSFCIWLIVVIIKFVIFWKEGSLKESTDKAKSLFGKKENPDPVWTTKDAPRP